MDNRYRFEECNPADRLACRKYGREYCCATYHIPDDVPQFYQSTYGPEQTNSLFNIKTGCELNPSYYNFTQWVYEEWDIGYYTCPDYHWSGASSLVYFTAAVTSAIATLMML